jgi:Ala-tRNA(Pro) deacylase
MASNIQSNGTLVHEALCSLLNENQIEYCRKHHEATFTSVESAKARNEDLALGGKAIVMKIDDDFKLLVLSASKKTDSKKLKEFFKAKKTRFATSEELMQLTGLVPGSVPPFGRPIIPLDLFLDESITRNEKIAFNAGLLTDSIVMKVNDFLNIAKPIKVFTFSSD